MSSSRGQRFCSVALLVVALAVVAAAATAPVAAASASDAAAVQHSDSADATVAVDDLDGQRFWAGQTVEITGFDDAETFELGSGNDVREFTATDGTVVVDTGDLAAGEWDVDPDGFGADGTFVLSEQTLTVEDATTTDGASLAVESNRAVYALAIGSDDLDAETLAAAVEGARVDGDRVVVEVTDGATAIDVDASELPGGVYGLDAAVVDSTASDAADLSVSAGLEVEGAHPLPYEGSDRLYDVNGDRSITNSDVVDFFGFQHYHPAVDEHPAKFDFDGSGDVGQSDVIELFEVVNGKSIANPNATIVGGPFQENAHDVAEIPVDVAGTDTAYVTLDATNYDYTATIELENLADADGPVTIEASPAPLPGDADEPSFAGEHVANVSESGERADPNLNTSPMILELRSYTDDPRTGATATDGTDLEFRNSYSYVARFDGPFSTEEYGVAEISLQTAVTNDAYVNVSLEEYDYTATVELANLDEADEPVTFDVDTYLLGHDEAEGTFTGEHVAGFSEYGEFADLDDSQRYDGGFEFRLRSYVDDPREDAAPKDVSRLRIEETADDAHVSFENGPYGVEARGDAEIPVKATGTDTAFLNLSLEDYDYQATVRLTGLAGADEPATVTVDTYTLGHETNDTFTGEHVAGYTESGDLTESLRKSELYVTDAFSFRLRSYTQDPRAGADPVDVSRLRLQDAPTAVFEEGSYAVAEGDLARVDLNVDDTNEAWVTVEHEDVDGTGVVHLEDLASGSATVGIDTAALSRGEAAADVVRVLDGSLGPDTDLTGAIAEGERGWSEGDELTLRSYTDHPDEDEVLDRARLEIEAAFEEPPDARLSADEYAVYEDRTATIDVNLTGTDEAWVRLEHAEYDGAALVHLVNAIRYEGPVTVAVDTSRLSKSTPVTDVFDVDGAELGPDTSETGEFANASSGGPFGSNDWAAGTEFAVRAYSDDPEANDATDRARLEIVEPPIGDVTTYVAPVHTDLELADEPADLLEDATRSPTVAEGDVVIAQVSNAVHADSIGETASEFDAEDQDLRFALRHEQQGAFGSTVEVANVSDPGVAEDVTLLSDPENDRFFVAFEAGTLFDPSDEVQLVYEVGPNGEYQDGIEGQLTERSSVRLEARDITITGDARLTPRGPRLLVETVEDSEITAETNVAPNTRGTFFVETQNDAASDEFTVGDDGVVTATFDFSDAEGGEVLPSIEFDEDGGASDSIEGVFEDVPPPSFAAVADAPDQVDVDGDTTLDVEVQNQGGSTGEAQISVTVDGEKIAAENVQLEPGDVWEESIDVPTHEAGAVDWEVSTQHDSEAGTVEVGSGN